MCQLDCQTHIHTPTHMSIKKHSLGKDIGKEYILVYFQWLAVPFALQNEAVSDILQTANSNETGWLGSVEDKYKWVYIDKVLQLILGGIPWQVKYLN